MSKRFRRTLEGISIPVLAVLLGLVAASVFVVIAGASPVDTYQNLFCEGFGPRGCETFGDLLFMQVEPEEEGAPAQTVFSPLYGDGVGLGDAPAILSAFGYTTRVQQVEILFYNLLNPDAIRSNPLQQASDHLLFTQALRQFSTPGGIPSHVSVTTPGSIHEGGELGYVLSHAFGAAFDNPDLLVVAVVGDGEAETGPLEGAWKSTHFLNRPEQLIVGDLFPEIAVPHGGHVGRNEACPCGSGKKFKKCCGKPGA